MEFEAELTEVIRRTPNVKSFRFARPRSFDYRPGQYIYVKLSSGLSSHFTISSSPTEPFLEFTKRLTGHTFSNALDALRVGDRVRVGGPDGGFTFEGEHQKVGMLSGGIGITPLRSMCRYCTDRGIGSNIVLIYSNHSPEEIAFREDLEEMEGRNPNLRVVFTVSEPGPGWNGLTGRIDAEMVKREIPDYRERVFYTCGPAAMVDAMVKLLKELELPKEQIRKETFPGY